MMLITPSALTTNREVAEEEATNLNTGLIKRQELHQRIPQEIITDLKNGKIGKEVQRLQCLVVLSINNYLMKVEE